MPDEINAIRDAVRLAEDALAAADAALTVGVTERHLTAVFMEAMATAGVTTPTTQDVAWITSKTAPWSRSSRDTAVGEGDLVVFDAGVIRNGYVGEVGRTRAVGDLAVDRWAVAGPLGRAVGSVPVGLPPRGAGHRSARGLRRRRRADAADPRRPWARPRQRPAPGERRTPADRCRAATRGRHGAGTHGVRLARRGRRRSTARNRSSSPTRAPICCRRSHFARQGARSGELQSRSRRPRTSSGTKRIRKPRSRPSPSTGRTG